MPDETIAPPVSDVAALLASPDWQARIALLTSQAMAGLNALVASLHQVEGELNRAAEPVPATELAALTAPATTSASASIETGRWPPSGAGAFIGPAVIARGAAEPWAASVDPAGELAAAIGRDLLATLPIPLAWLPAAISGGSGLGEAVVHPSFGWDIDSRTGPEGSAV